MQTFMDSQTLGVLIPSLRQTHVDNIFCAAHFTSLRTVHTSLINNGFDGGIL